MNVEEFRLKTFNDPRCRIEAAPYKFLLAKFGCYFCANVRTIICRLCGLSNKDAYTMYNDHAIWKRCCPRSDAAKNVPLGIMMRRQMAQMEPPHNVVFASNINAIFEAPTPMEVDGNDVKSNCSNINNYSPHTMMIDNSLMTIVEQQPSSGFTTAPHWSSAGK